jgi:hypothetical protein
MTVGLGCIWGRTIRQQHVLVCVAKHCIAPVYSLPHLHVTDLACSVGGFGFIIPALFYLPVTVGGTRMLEAPQAVRSVLLFHVTA